MQKPLYREDAYNFDPDESCCVSTGKLASLFCDALGPEAVWETQGDSGPHEANFLKLDCSKAKAVLGWKPRWDIQTAVGKAVEYAQIPGGAEKKACVDRRIGEYVGAGGET